MQVCPREQTGVALGTVGCWDGHCGSLQKHEAGGCWASWLLQQGHCCAPWRAGGELKPTLRPRDPTAPAPGLGSGSPMDPSIMPRVGQPLALLQGGERFPSCCGAGWQPPVLGYLMHKFRVKQDGVITAKTKNAGGCQAPPKSSSLQESLPQPRAAVLGWHQPVQCQNPAFPCKRTAPWAGVVLLEAETLPLPAFAQISSWGRAGELSQLVSLP